MNTSNHIVKAAANAAFGKPLINNVNRSLVVEAIVAAALGEEWDWCSGDWGPFDFLGPLGLKLEVKQSAARQSWALDGDKPSRGSFDIAPRKWIWSADKGWEKFSGRIAEVYIFAWHPHTDAAADHRDPDQWLFWVIPTQSLPQTLRISQAALREQAEPVRWTELQDALRKLATKKGSERCENRNS